MTRPAQIATMAVGLMVLLAAAPSSHAADQKAVLDQIKAHNQAATTAYATGKWDQMKSELQEAVTLANDNGLSKHASLAQTYVLLGVAEVESKNKDAGISDFVKALEISAAAEVPSKMNKKAVKAAFSKAEDKDATEATKEPAPAEPKKSDKADKAEKTDNKDKEKQAAATDKEKDKEKDGQADKAAQAEKEKAAADKRAQAEREKQSKDLAAAKENESKAQAARDKVEKEKQNADKQLTDSKAQLAQAQKDKTDKEQELAALKTNEKKEREAREKLEKAKLDSDKQLADLKTRVQQLEKDNADKDHQLAIMRDEDKKARDAKDKLEKVWQEADAKEKDRKARETEREKLVEGPDLPKNFSEPLHCTVPDEAAAGADLYVHCAAQPKVGAKLMVFYYRPAGVVPYNAILMEPSKKGWFTAVVPANRLSGKFLHYYIEARDARQEVAVSNGKPSSPDVLTILPPGSAVVASQTAPSNGSLKQASATEKPRKRAKAR